jgi:hypothetical protein
MGGFVSVGVGVGGMGVSVGMGGMGVSVGAGGTGVKVGVGSGEIWARVIGIPFEPHTNATTNAATVIPIK